MARGGSTHTYTHTHTHTRTHIHTYIHTHTHTHNYATWFRKEQLPRPLTLLTPTLSLLTPDTADPTPRRTREQTARWRGAGAAPLPPDAPHS